MKLPLTATEKLAQLLHSAPFGFAEPDNERLAAALVERRVAITAGDESPGNPTWEWTFLHPGCVNQWRNYEGWEPHPLIFSSDQPVLVENYL